MKAFWMLGLGSAAPTVAFDVLHHLGGNSPWFASPNVNNVSPQVPDGCTVDQAVYIVRHGSRYPDPSAYQQWLALYDKIQSSQYNASGALAFLPDWTPVLRHPDQELSQVSITGYKELQYPLRPLG
ncbi:hypothetical protein DTO195F2_4731 [Paecilomyces variotii]|nr:hypothetical protein DTO195F2_4731 [Paecilomyces variotii]